MGLSGSFMGLNTGGFASAGVVWHPRSAWRARLFSLPISTRQGRVKGRLTNYTPPPQNPTQPNPTIPPAIISHHLRPRILPSGRGCSECTLRRQAGEQHGGGPKCISGLVPRIEAHRVCLSSHRVPLLGRDYTHYFGSGLHCEWHKCRPIPHTLFDEQRKHWDTFANK